LSPDHAIGLHGVRWARAAAITSLLGLVIAWLGPIAVVFVTGVEVHYGGFHLGTGKATLAGIEDILMVVLLGALITLVSLILYAISFNSFRKTGPGFGGPMALVIIGLVGLLLVLVGFGIVLSDFFSAVACAGAGASSSCIDVSQIAGAVLAILGGLFLAFLGWIGLLIGIYRVGKRYDSTVTKVGAILSIIPIIGFAAPILIFIGTHQILRRIQRGIVAV
jgi:hypothetical protein